MSASQPKNLIHIRPASIVTVFILGLFGSRPALLHHLDRIGAESGVASLEGTALVCLIRNRLPLRAARLRQKIEVGLKVMSAVSGIRGLDRILEVEDLGENLVAGVRPQQDLLLFNG